MRSRICACTVTSSAVVGSSAMSRRGSLTRAMAIMARCRMPPENSCGYWSIRLRRVGDADPVEHLERPLAGVRLVHARLVGADRPRRSACRSCSTGAARTAGPGRSWPSCCRAGRAAARPRRSSRSSPSSQISPLTRGPGLAVQAQDRLAGHGLARPGLADDADGPAPLEREGQAVDGLDHAVVGREVDAQVAAPSGSCHPPGRRCSQRGSRPCPSRTHGPGAHCGSRRVPALLHHLDASRQESRTRGSMTP